MKFDIHYDKENGIYVSFTLDNYGWVSDRYEENPDEPINFFHIFSITKEYFDAGGGILNENDESLLTSYVDVCFKLGDKIPGGYLIKPGVIGKYSLIIREGSELKNKKYFVAERNISVFKKIMEVVNNNITVGDQEGDLSVSTLDNLIRKFPTTTEINHYVNDRISSVVSEDIDVTKDYSLTYNKYLEKKLKNQSFESLDKLTEYDLEKFTFIYEKMKDMLIHNKSYTETDWQKQISKIMLSIFPQYILAIREQVLPKTFNHGRKVDFLLINSSGYVDIMEIKHPKISFLAKRRDHNNVVPSKKLSDCVMQTESYIYSLLQCSPSDKKKIDDKVSEKLSFNLNVNILNPNGLIIMGYSETGWNEEEKFAIETIRRQYRHIVDVITYNDLLERLDNIIKRFKKGSSVFDN